MIDKNISRALDELVGSCGVFKVLTVTKDGAYVGTGGSKDLFVPRSQQLVPMKLGESYIVYVLSDEKDGRVIGSSKLNKYLYDDAPDGLKERDQVDLIVYSKTDMGYKVVVGKDAWGLLYKNEVFRDLSIGQKLKGYVKKLREDGRLDISLDKGGFQAMPDLSQQILTHLKSKGSSPLSDKTPAEEIYQLFGVSKNKFKMAVGNLYKKRLLDIKNGYIQPIAVCVKP
ncbi:MAG: GntR family transcriptional regulator [Candidatus Omnitrophica bacterium]|nr:GntR family transcriptional regulator [Candidatus Omnitrophota bacterium]